MFKRKFALSGVATSGGRAAAPLAAQRSLLGWLADHRELLWAVLLALVAGMARGWNMFHFPYYESDEGTYMSQAWALLHLGKLAPYTYWYDHAPGGWVQIALWSLLTGGFYTFGEPVNSGRVLMLLMHLGSVLMVYRIARSLSRSWVAPTIAVLAWSFSAYGAYYGRRVLLDNISVFWMLLSTVVLLGKRVALKRVWISALALGIGILSKEQLVFLIPALAYLVWHCIRGPQRVLATAGWLGIVGAVCSSYIMLALLKGELFPTGTWLGGTAEHVSLLGSLQYQSSRGNDAGVLDWNSGFWAQVRTWLDEEPLLLVAGTGAAALSLLLFPWRRRIAILGALTFSLWAFIGRGGVTLPFYLVPLLPLLAINLGLLIGLIVDGFARLVAQRRWLAWIGPVAQVGGLALGLAYVPLGYRNPHLEFNGDRLVLWRSTQADVHRLATDWAIANLPRGSRVIIDMSMWLDLRDIPGQAEGFEQAHYYWKVIEDPEIRDMLLHDDWRNVDYIITTNQMKGDVDQTQDGLMLDVLAHSTSIASFDTGGWPVEVLQVHHAYQDDAAAVLKQTWESYQGHFIEGGRVIDRGNQGRTTSEGQAYAMLRAVYMDDRVAFDQVWEWTREHLQQPGGTLAWLYGAQADGAVGVLDTGGATDGDQDAALALLFASKRWVEPRYHEEALTIMRGIWEEETATVQGRRLLVAGQFGRGEQGSDIVINPSYFAPYAYRIFAQADPTRPWSELVDSGYQVLERIQADGRFGGRAGLVPNWVALDPQTGALRPATEFGDYANEYSFDASRLPWRLALDWLWSKDQRSWRALQALDGVEQALKRDGRLAAEYRLDGTPDAEHEALSMYAGAMGSFMFSMDRELPQRVYAEQLAGSYTERGDDAYWGDPNNYYDQNWAWFAVALLNEQMNNIWES